MTTAVFVARSVTQLTQINQLIHDEWFDAEEVVFDEGSAAVTIPFIRPSSGPERPIGRVGPFHRVEVSYCESFLRILHVRRWHFEDRQRVGRYDFNEVVYDLAAKTIRITTGIPISLLAEIDELEVVVEETDKLVAVKIQRKLL